MAVYPLKNIAIGSNTYQIQGGEFYIIEIATSSISADAFNTFPSKTHITSDSTITVYDVNGNVQSSFDFSKLMTAPCVVHIITSGSGGNIDSYAGLIGIDTAQAPTYFTASFESDWKSPSSVPTRYGVQISILQGGIDEVNGYALQVSGGSSIAEYIVQDQYGNALSVSNFLQGGTVQLVSGGAASDTDILSDFNAGEVLLHVGGEYDFNKIHFKLDGYNVGSTNSIYGWFYNSGKKLALFEYSGSRKWNLQIIN